jgi:putative restriction endonuclease
LFTVTADRSAKGRPPGEHKIQLIVEGQRRGQAGKLHLGDVHTVLLGFSPDFGVFVGWESRLYTKFAYSANVQVREHLLAEARDNGWAVAAARRIRGSEEVRVAFSSGNLSTFLRLSRSADLRGLSGIRREAFMLAHVPNYQAHGLPKQADQLADYVQQERQRLQVSRLSRDSRFASRVKASFEYACCVCDTQLQIVEAAHIIPVNDARGTDDQWNGLCMCPNHHALFDARRFVVLENLRIAVDTEAVKFLRDLGRSSGLKLLRDYDGQRIRYPNFWRTSHSLRNQLKSALRYTSSLTPIRKRTRKSSSHASG